MTSEVDNSNPNWNDIAPWVEKAKSAMGIGDGKAFSEDVLRVEVCGPNQPHLTLVDLPGLFHSGNKHQSEQDVSLVKKMVESYIARDRSVILAVVSAHNEPANQIIPKLAKDHDQKNQRTLGIITKPDLVKTGSKLEATFLELSNNRVVYLKLGWHVIKNRDYENRDCSDAERDEQEKNFFRKGVWGSLDPNIVGIGALRLRLSDILRDLITRELPNVLSDVGRAIDECKRDLQELGQHRSTVEQQRLYLVGASHTFAALIRGALEGHYEGYFFVEPEEDSKSDHIGGSAASSIETTAGGQINLEDDCCENTIKCPKRLRAVVQAAHTLFDKNMKLCGHSTQVVEDEKRDSRVTSGTMPAQKLTAGFIRRSFAKIEKPTEIKRSSYYSDVSRLRSQSRGFELPGLFRPDIVGQLFMKEIKPWRKISNIYAKMIQYKVSRCVKDALESVLDKVTATTVFKTLFDPIFKQRSKILNDKIAELLDPHEKGILMTSNHYFTDIIQKDRGERQRKKLADYAKQAMTNNPHGIKDSTVLANVAMSMIQQDPDTFASEEVTIAMSAYYKVQLKLFIDNFFMYGIQGCLPKDLDQVFTPQSVMQLDHATLASLAAETQENADRRDYLQNKLNSLVKGLKTLKTYELGSMPDFLANMEV